MKMKVKNPVAYGMFYTKINWLRSPGARGKRNPALCGIARLGLKSGLPPEQVYEILAQTDGLAEAECRRAVETVLRSDAPNRRRFLEDFSIAEKMARLGEPEDFETEMRRAQEASGIHTADPALQAEIQLDSLGGGLRWFCAQKDARRTRAGIVEGLPGGGLPELVTLNRLTGGLGQKSDGGESYVCDGSVAECTHWLVEFDDKPLEWQMGWLAGNFSQWQKHDPDALDIRTAVYSGGKSVHFAVASEPGIDMLEKLHRVCPQADRAVWHPGTLTRLAGAVRSDTGRLQQLIFARSFAAA